MTTVTSMEFGIWFGFMCWMAVSGDRCAYKVECSCTGTYIDCANRGLTGVPFYDSTGEPIFITLIFDNNNITEISSGNLPVGLMEISFINNPITTIDDNAFQELASTLESLYFMYGQFERIPSAFLQLNVLKNLNIVDTKILDWNVGAMAHIGETLETLNIENVGLTTWPVWTQFFSRLDEMSVSGGSIASIPDNAFENLSKTLKILTLFNNSLTSVPKALSGLNSLRSLDLHDNQISDLTWLPASSKLTDLSLNNNSISDANHLSDYLRPFGDSLLDVTLSFNQLTVIPDFSFLTKINSLDLSHNLISDHHSGSTSNGVYELNLSYNLLPSFPTIFMSLKMLMVINLSHNVIEELQGKDIPSWITDLDLSNNLISELTDTSFPNNSAIESLVLSNNPIVTISNLAFTNLPTLYSLYLKATNLTRLPLSLNYLAKLGFLELSDCPDLMCTCLEKDLKPKIISGIEVFGNCEKISILNFYKNVSLTCP